MYLLLSQLWTSTSTGTTEILGWSAVALAMLIDVAMLTLPWSRWKRTAQFILLLR